jgi:tripartite-type tricarboxylate transporter receptor subunit TctC
MKRVWLSMMVFAVVVGGPGMNQPVAAADYPNKPINCIIPMEPGADGDINMRTIMKKASEILGQPIVIINKPGAGHTMGYREVHKAKPDGYTIGTCASTLIMAKMQGMYPYNHNDFSLIAFGYHALPIVLASTTSKNTFQTIDEVVAFAKANPNKVSMATTSVGGAYWIAAQMVEGALKVNFNLIPQEGSAGYVVTAVAGGHTDLGVTSFSAAKGQIEAGKIRFLAVAGPQRYPGTYNHVKTLRELGYDASLSSFASVLGPPKLPKVGGARKSDQGPRSREDRHCPQHDPRVYVARSVSKILQRTGRRLSVRTAKNGAVKDQVREMYEYRYALKRRQTV